MWCRRATEVVQELFDTIYIIWPDNRPIIILLQPKCTDINNVDELKF